MTEPASNKNVDVEASYWNTFYTKWKLAMPSQFCTLTATEVSTADGIAEFGCGNGRDAFFLARHGYPVAAMDLSSEAIANNAAQASEKGLTKLQFRQGDVTAGPAVANLLASARSLSTSQRLVVYSRFFLHTLTDEQEAAFLGHLAMHMQPGDGFYAEFRSQEDASLAKVFGNHFRRYVNTDEFVARLEARWGLRVSYRITGRGMAKYKDEDPFVSRVIAEKA